MACTRHTTLVAALAVLTLAATAGATHTQTYEQKQDAVLVGHPLAGSFGPSVEVLDTTVGSSVSYSFEVVDPNHWVEVHVEYDAGPRIGVGPCTQPTDLDMRITGPTGLVRDMDGCDDGKLSFVDRGLSQGFYEVRVHADQGVTLCTTDTTPVGEGCTLPSVDYTYTLHIWDPDDADEPH